MTQETQQETRKVLTELQKDLVDFKKLIDKIASYEQHKYGGYNLIGKIYLDALSDTYLFTCTKACYVDIALKKLDQ